MLLLSSVQIPLARISRMHAGQLLVCMNKSHPIRAWKPPVRISRMHVGQPLVCMNKSHAIRAWKLPDISRKLLVHISRMHAGRLLVCMNKSHAIRVWKPLVRISRKRANRSRNSLTKLSGGEREISSRRSLYAWHSLIVLVLRVARDLMAPMLAVRIKAVVALHRVALPG
jgi:hypothetical protein